MGRERERTRLVECAPVNAPFSYPNSSVSISPWGIAGQLTFTSSPTVRSEVPWIRRAISSLPVPLSPCTSTATLVLATISNFRRMTCISGVRPKMISTGGRSIWVSCSEKRTVVMVSYHWLHLRSSAEDDIHRGKVHLGLMLREAHSSHGFLSLVACVVPPKRGKTDSRGMKNSTPGY